MDYEKQAADFMTATNTTMETRFLRTGLHFPDDKDQRDIYEITLNSKGRVYKFNFGQSINASGEYKILDKRMRPSPNREFCTAEEAKKIKMKLRPIFTERELNEKIIKNPNHSAPTAYAVLSSLTKYDPQTLEEFCSEYGYNVDSRKAERVYNAVREEYLQVSRLFTETELELMAEIQ